MSGISGYPSQEKLVNPLVGYDQIQSKTSSQFVTVSETHDKHVVQDVRINGAFRTTALPKTLTSIDTVYPKQVLKCTSHGALKGDIVRFEGTSANPHFAAMVILVPDADTMILGATLLNTPIIADEFFVLRHVVPLYDEDGTLSVSSGPLQFILDGLTEQVSEDTGTPANSVPLPVKVLDDAGLVPDFATQTTLQAVESELTDVNTELDAQTVLITNIDNNVSAIATDTAQLADAVNEQGTAAGTFQVQVAGIDNNGDSMAINLNAQGEVLVSESLPIGNYAEITTLTTTDQTFSPPSNTIGFYIQAWSTNSENVRFKVAGTASPTSGAILEPGRSEYIPAGGSVSVCAAAGTNQAVSVMFVNK